MFSVMFSVWWVSTFEHTRLVLLWNFNEMRSGSLSTMRISRFLSLPAFEGYQLLNIPNWSNWSSFQWDEEAMFLFYNETQTFSVTTNVQLVSTFEHTQLVLIWVFWWDEECSLSTMRIRQFPSQTSVWWVSTFEHTQLVLIWVFFWAPFFFSYPDRYLVWGTFKKNFHSSLVLALGPRPFAWYLL